MKRELRLHWLLLGSLICSTGGSLLWPLTTIYMHDYLHQSLTVAGTVLFFNSITLIIGSWLGGYIYDHGKVRFFLILSVLMQAASVFLLIFFHGWPYFAFLLILDNFGNGISSTIVSSLATGIKEKDPRYVFNMIYFMQNVGVVAGTMLVGYVIEISINMIFIVNFAMYAVFLLIVWLFYFVPQHVLAKHASQKKGASDKTPKKAAIVIFAALALYFAIDVGYSQWQSNLSVYMGQLGIPVKNYSLLWTINGIIIVLIQPLINRFDESFQTKLTHKIYLGIVLFVFGFSSLIFAKSYPYFVLSMAIVTLGEVLTFPTFPAFVSSLSSFSEKGKYQGLVTAFPALGRAVGPVLGGIIIDNFSYAALFTFTSAFVIIVGSILIGCAKINLDGNGEIKK